MFKRNRKQQMDWALAANRPINVTQQASSEAAAVLAHHFALFVIGLAVLGIGYIFILAMLQNAGYHNPHKVFAEAAMFAINALAAFGVFAGVLWLIKWFVLSVMDTRHAHKMEELDRLLEIEQIKLRNVTAAPAGATRLNDQDSTFVKLLQLVMQEAYSQRDTSGREWKYNEAKPWSRAQVLEWGDKLARPTSPLLGQVTWSQAAMVGSWLKQHRVVTDNDINLRQYATMQEFNALVEREFYLPVMLSDRGKGL